MTDPRIEEAVAHALAEERAALLQTIDDRRHDHFLGRGWNNVPNELMGLRLWVERRAAATTTTVPETPHVYLSTACRHHQHAECRLACKFCSVACSCACHSVDAKEVAA